MSLYVLSYFKPVLSKKEDTVTWVPVIEIFTAENDPDAICRARQITGRDMLVHQGKVYHPMESPLGIPQLEKMGQVEMAEIPAM